MYFHATYHETEDYPKLLIKIEDKRNQTNQNEQWIGVENREEEGKKINIVTRGGAKTREDAAKKDQYQHQWVRKNTVHEHMLDVCKEKEIFKEVSQEILKENIASTSGTKPVDEITVYNMPSLFDQTNQEQSSKQVSNLRNVLGACVKLSSDKKSLQVHQN
jgi:autotransporter adhesin